MLSRLVPSFYNVTLISPENFFLFTPLLASTAVGTVESRSIVEPIRNITTRYKANYFCAEVKEVCIEESSVLCQTSQGQDFKVDYDFLVLAVGAEVNTFGCPGVNGKWDPPSLESPLCSAEYAIKLKKYEDARTIRRRITANIEAAMIPTVDEASRKRMLTNVIVGGGPTGVEFAAELYDLIWQDFTQRYPQELLRDFRVILVQSADHVLNTYDLTISQYAESLFARHGIDILKNARVVAIKRDAIQYEEKGSDLLNKVSLSEIPYGICVWATGIRMVPLIDKLSQLIPEQVHNHALIVDDWLRIRGVPAKNLFALGDCATVELPKLRPYFQKFLENQISSIRVSDLSNFTDCMLREHPELRIHYALLMKLVRKFSQNTDCVSPVVLDRLIQEVELSMRTLPATAQVAQQQGRYLANQLNALAINRITRGAGHSHLAKSIKMVHPPFLYHHAGMSAYVGSHHTVLDLGKVVLADRYLAFWLWRSIYLSEQVSLRTRVMVAFDWTKTLLFGRDISSPV